MATAEEVRNYLAARSRATVLASAPGDQSIYVWKGDILLDHFPATWEWQEIPVIDENNPSRPTMGFDLEVWDAARPINRRTYKLGQWTTIRRGDNAS